ncbi:MAG: DUF192 domain-containing protein [Nitrospira sp.]|nr:DUF192 domain-containing protein [Nitrospira sp.]
MQPLGASIGLAIALLTGFVLTGLSVSASDGWLIPIKTPAGVVVQAEIADTPLKRAVGLMYRDHLDKDRGMLFLFGQPQAWGFWMKNTKIPLDMIWMDAKKRVVHVERHVPICTKTDDSCPLYKPNSEDAMYVLELAGGAAEVYKIEKGSVLEFKVP